MRNKIAKYSLKGFDALTFPANTKLLSRTKRCAIPKDRIFLRMMRLKEILACRGATLTGHVHKAVKELGKGGCLEAENDYALQLHVAARAQFYPLIPAS
jgi:hypothetical protein